MEKKRPSLSPPSEEPLTLDFDDDLHSSERQTVMPEFDVDAYAKEAMGAPDSAMRAIAASDVAVTMPPPVRSVAPDLSDVRPAPGPVPPPSNDQALADMRAYLVNQDFSSALVVAEALLEEDPNNREAKECVLRCQAALQAVYLRRLGSLHQVPVLALSKTELRQAAIDHRSGFLLSLMDGVSTLEMILDVSGMPMLESLRVVLGLVDQGVITLA